MEKYLRLLKPKTTNYEAIGGGSYGSITSQDVCAAISYAKLSELQTILLELYMNHYSFDQIKKFAVVIAKLEDQIDAELAIYVALLEVFNAVPDYRPSERNRAMLAGVSRMQIQRTLGPVINRFKNLFTEEMKELEMEVKNQLKKST